jgi:hypothetical protein
MSIYGLRGMKPPAIYEPAMVAALTMLALG